MRPKPKYSPVGLFECTSSIRERSAGPCRYATLPCHVPPLGVVSLRSYVSVVDHVPERKLISFSISRWGLGIMPSPLAACFVAAVLWVALPGGFVSVVSCAAAAVNKQSSTAISNASKRNSFMGPPDRQRVVCCRDGISTRLGMYP